VLLLDAAVPEPPEPPELLEPPELQPAATSPMTATAVALSHMGRFIRIAAAEPRPSGR